MNTESLIAKDLELCDLGAAITSSRVKRQYVAHRAACFAEIKAMNKRDGLDGMSDADLLAALLA